MQNDKGSSSILNRRLYEQAPNLGYASTSRSTRPQESIIESSDVNGNGEWEQFHNETLVNHNIPFSHDNHNNNNNTFRNQNTDGAQVLELLQKDNNEEDTWQNTEAQILHAQQDPFRQQLESKPNANYNSNNKNAQNSESDYLYNLLTTCNDGKDIVDYIQQTTYTDDVWGLPEQIIQALEQIRNDNDNEAESKSESSKDIALRRLMQLKGHLESSNTESSRESLAKSSDWQTLWDQALAQRNQF